MPQPDQKHISTYLSQTINIYPHVLARLERLNQKNISTCINQTRNATRNTYPCVSARLERCVQKYLSMCLSQTRKTCPETHNHVSQLDQKHIFMLEVEYFTNDELEEILSFLCTSQMLCTSSLSGWLFFSGVLLFFLPIFVFVLYLNICIIEL